MNKHEYSIGEMARITGVTKKTLHHYDRISLLSPEGREENGYRVYTVENLIRLQQVLFFKELGFSLKQISDLMGDPSFELRESLMEHRKLLKLKQKRLGQLVKTIDLTLWELEREGDLIMSDLFKGFDSSKEKEYRREAREKYDPVLVAQSEQNYKNMREDQKKAWQEKLDACHRQIAGAIGRLPADAEEVQEAVGGMHRLFNDFYDCSTEIFRGLGQMYCDDPRFRATYEAYHPKMPEYLREAMAVYSDRKEKS
ncbi:MAG: MerR family transcriptional regulator [Spirochaetales bacterium]|nr:MerR family transcriptional regulator [Spirochaetales bacterium]